MSRMTFCDTCSSLQNSIHTHTGHDWHLNVWSVSIPRITYYIWIPPSYNENMDLQNLHSQDGNVRELLQYLGAHRTQNHLRWYRVWSATNSTSLSLVPYDWNRKKWGWSCHRNRNYADECLVNEVIRRLGVNADTHSNHPFGYTKSNWLWKTA